MFGKNIYTKINSGVYAFDHESIVLLMTIHTNLMFDDTCYIIRTSVMHARVGEVICL